jgi:hypothetical protein
VRENRTHGSEGGDGESRSRPLSGLLRRISLDTRFRGYDGTQAGHSFSSPNGYFQRRTRRARRKEYNRKECKEHKEKFFVSFVILVVIKILGIRNKVS